MLCCSGSHDTYVIARYCARSLGMTEPRIIKRYANRKLYDTQHSRYVTLDQISEMIRDGDDVEIIDNRTKEDLTSVTLAQIIFEEEKKQRSFLSLQAMRNIIQHGGESVASLVSHAQRKVTNILDRKPKQDESGESDGQQASQEQPTPDGDPNERLLREFRNWLQQSQRTLASWQQRANGHLSEVVPGTAIIGLRSDVRAFATRIEELERELTTLSPSEQDSPAK